MGKDSLRAEPGVNQCGLSISQPTNPGGFGWIPCFSVFLAGFLEIHFCISTCLSRMSYPELFTTQDVVLRVVSGSILD
jgi:hypothetical protein